VADPRAPLAILAVLGAVLVFAGLGDGTRTSGGTAGSGGASLPPNVAVRIVAPDPRRTVPPLTRRLARGAAAPGLASLRPLADQAPLVQRWGASLERAGLEPVRDLLAPFSVLVITIERSCPPPAVLACRPAIRVTGRLRGEPPADLKRNLRIATVAGLRAAGFRGLTARSSGSGGRVAGRVTSGGELLARWRLFGGVLEVASSGLTLDSPVSAAALAAPPTAPGGATQVEIDTNPKALAAILG
jgi:hypothetical protein